MRIRILLVLLVVVLLFILFSPASPIKFRANAKLADVEEVTDDEEHAREKMIDERFDVDEDGSLAVNVGDADVEVTVGSSDEVHVQVFLEGRNMRRARDFFERQHFDVHQEGNTVYVETDAEDTHHFFSGDWRDHPNIEVKISAPERFNADLRTSDGDVHLARMEGKVRLRTSDGDVSAGTLAGSSAELRTSDGDIRLEAVESDMVEIQTSDGDIALDNVSAGTVSIRTSDGDIRADQITSQGDVSMQTSDGDIRVTSVVGDTFSCRTSDGDVFIDELVVGAGTVRASDGTVNLRRVEGALDVSGGDADIRVGIYQSADVSLQTSDGDILITAPADLAADIRLRGDDVRVASDFNFNGEIEDELADGEINGGGPLIEARASSGDVTLRTH